MTDFYWKRFDEPGILQERGYDVPADLLTRGAGIGGTE
jgi:hypothetical protein